MNINSLYQLLSVPGITIAEVTSEVAEKYGYLIKILRKQGTTIPTNDIWIAATALDRGIKLITLDGHFEKVPGVLLKM